MGCVYAISKLKKGKKATKIKQYVPFIESESTDTVSACSPPMTESQSPITMIKFPTIRSPDKSIKSPVPQFNPTPKPFTFSHLNMSGIDLVQLLSLNNTFLDNDDGEDRDVAFDPEDLGIINDLKIEMTTQDGLSPLDLSFAVLTPTK